MGRINLWMMIVAGSLSVNLSVYHCSLFRNNNKSKLMKKFNLVYSGLLMAVVLVFTHCAKDGDTGPQGPAGPAGPLGPIGTQGPKGDTGTANVVYSAWLDVEYDAVTTTAGDTIAWAAEIPAPKLTSAILTRGEIKVYLNAGTAADPAVFPLPINDLYALTGISNLNAYFTLSAINLYSTEDASTFTEQGVKAFQYRYILIPGVVPGRMSTINWNNYEEVKKHLGLLD
jgi:hypothetical protein